MAEELQVETRDQRGKHNNRRLRRAGRIPAILYGHGEQCVSLAIPADKLVAALRHGSRLVNLTGAANESAFIRELQWDTFGTSVLHVDLTRISAHEKVQVSITVELRGEAPGVRAGGVVEQLLHEVQIECPAGSIPDRLTVNINTLKLEDAITVAGLVVPEGARVLADPEAVVVHCIVPAELPEEGAGEAAPGEPEVIGEKKEEESEES
jgi:large subunit ribosomal protein L25